MQTRAFWTPAALFVRFAHALAPSLSLAVVLTDNGTASSGEIFAGVLRDQGRAVIMGDRTYGKGLIQYYFPVGGGGAGA